MYNTHTYMPSSFVQGDLYLDWIESTLIPASVKTFPRLLVDLDRLGILGSSLVCG